jgi:hypothetical protein
VRRWRTIVAIAWAPRGVGDPRQGLDGWYDREVIVIEHLRDHPASLFGGRVTLPRAEGYGLQQRFARIISDKQCGAGFSLRGTSSRCERLV